MGIAGDVVETHSGRQTGNLDVCSGVCDMDGFNVIAFAYRLGGVTGRKGDRRVHLHHLAGTGATVLGHVAHTRRERVTTGSIG